MADHDDNLDALDARIRASRARRLRELADEDDARAEQLAETNPMYAEYCLRRAAHCRRVAADEDGGLGQ